MYFTASLTKATCLKHKFVLLLLVLGTSFASHSQVLFKARAGLNLSRLQRAAASFRADEDKQVFKPGPVAGAAVEYALKKGFSLQAELNYSLKGLKDKAEVVRNNGTYYGYGYNFHYIELPVLLRYAIKEKFHVGFGPSLSYLLNVDEIIEDIDVTDPSHKYKKLDLGLNADVAYSFDRFELGVRYNHGLRMVTYKGNEDLELPGSIDLNRKLGRNRTLQVYLAYRFKR